MNSDVGASESQNAATIQAMNFNLSPVTVEKQPVTFT